MSRENIIPVFIPFYGCPNPCIFCDQDLITGVQTPPSPQELKDIIGQQLGWFSSPAPIQVAFYGGSFTCLPIEIQKAYMEAVRPWIESGQVDSIRISTRPDALDPENIKLLIDKGLRTLELGVQSFSWEVLSSSHRYIDPALMEENIRRVKKTGLRLGLQQMIGLPGDTLERTLMTQEKIISLGPDFVRIYPTIVLENTGLAQAYLEGAYKPLGLDQALAWTARLLKAYKEAGIEVIRVGLPPSDDPKENGRIAGPWHPQFRELAETLWMVQDLEEILEDHHMSGTLEVQASQKNINRLVGPGGRGRARLEAQGLDLTFKNTKDDRIKLVSAGKTLVWDWDRGGVHETSRA